MFRLSEDQGPSARRAHRRPREATDRWIPPSLCLLASRLPLPPGTMPASDGGQRSFRRMWEMLSVVSRVRVRDQQAGEEDLPTQVGPIPPRALPLPVLPVTSYTLAHPSTSPWPMSLRVRWTVMATVTLAGVCQLPFELLTCRVSLLPVSVCLRALALPNSPVRPSSSRPTQAPTPTIRHPLCALLSPLRAKNLGCPTQRVRPPPKPGPRQMRSRDQINPRPRPPPCRNHSNLTVHFQDM